MGLKLLALVVVAFLASTVHANIFPTEPIGTTICSGGKNCTIEWYDDGSAPLLSSFTGGMAIELYTGSTYEQTMLATLGRVNATAGKAKVLIPSTVGPDGLFYFFRLIGVEATGNTSTVFTAKFTMANMTGTFDAAVMAELETSTSSAVALSTSAALTTVPSVLSVSVASPTTAKLVASSSSQALTTTSSVASTAKATSKVVSSSTSRFTNVRSTPLQYCVTGVVFGAGIILISSIV